MLDVQFGCPEACLYFDTYLKLIAEIRLISRFVRNDVNVIIKQFFVLA